MPDSSPHSTQIKNLNRNPLNDQYEFNADWERQRAEATFENTDIYVRQQDAKAMLAALDALRSTQEQLEVAQEALQRIYWNGCSGFVEETIIAVLPPEQRAEWAKTTSNLDVLDSTRTTRNDVGTSNPASEPHPHGKPLILDEAGNCAICGESL